MELDEDPAESPKLKSNEDLLPAEAPRRIKALDQDVVNKIAAGEIIIAPVHALKELTENAVDAGATSVEILVKDGGLKLLQITDNGHGINREDLPILCERFTTSKIKNFQDLSSIATYGFRGEALASISHIAHLRVTTRTKESSCAWQAHYSAGKLVAPKPGQSPEPKACAGRQGTQITVEDLFYNVPTRRRAFRSAGDEYAKILDLIGRYAIHCTGVAFSCKKHGDASMGISIQANATIVDRIRSIHSNAVANELIPLAADSSRWGFKANGYISNANYHVKKLTLMLFINHRAVESSALRKAITQTYSIFLPKGGHPFVYLSIDIEPHRLDVNVHPTKREVTFLNEDEIIEAICDEIRTSLGKVDTSRTFLTQSLLPGVKIPTISLSSPGSPSKRPAARADSDSESPAQPVSKRSAPSKPHESNLVRTDAKARKITSMLLPDTSNTRSPLNSGRPPADTDMNRGIDTNAPEQPPLNLQYTHNEREPTVCRLTSVKNLRTAVTDAMHHDLTQAISNHTFVGLVDERRRIAAIQSGVKLYLVDYGMLANEYFYQLGLTDFGNFGSIQLDPPLSLKEVLRMAAQREKKRAEASNDQDTADLDWGEVVAAVEGQLLSRRDMLSEYFSLELSEDGLVVGLPLLIKGYMPSIGKLPQFLLRLGPHVDWTDEQECFRTLLKELASWYVPEALPPPPEPGRTENNEDALMEDATIQEDRITPNNQYEDTVNEDDEDPTIKQKRNQLNHTLENILFPAFKSRMTATKGMTRGFVEIADLKGLYRVFERC